MPTDRELVERVIFGETEAFHGLVERYRAPVYRLVRRFLANEQDAMEVTQDCFVRAYERLSSFDVERRFSTWLLTVAANLARDRLRRRRRRPEILDHERFARIPGSSDPERSAVAREVAERLRAAVETLAEEKRLAVVLRYFEGLSLPEVAEITGTEVNTLKVRLFRARRELQTKLEEHE